jgi:hypothetical protein
MIVSIFDFFYSSLRNYLHVVVSVVLVGKQSDFSEFAEDDVTRRNFDLSKFLVPVPKASNPENQVNEVIELVRSWQIPSKDGSNIGVSSTEEKKVKSSLSVHGFLATVTTLDDIPKTLTIAMAAEPVSGFTGTKNIHLTTMMIRDSADRGIRNIKLITSDSGQPFLSAGQRWMKFRDEEDLLLLGYSPFQQYFAPILLKTGSISWLFDPVHAERTGVKVFKYPTREILMFEKEGKKWIATVDDLWKIKAQFQKSSIPLRFEDLELSTLWDQHTDGNERVIRVL